MKIALSQMKVVPGDIEKNLSTAKSMLKDALNQGAEIIALPEMCLTGYVLGDLWNSPSFRADAIEAAMEFAHESKNCTLIFGSPYLEQGRVNKDGRPRLYNAAYCYENQKPLAQASGHLPPGLQFKTLHPNYRVFDDSRYFFSLLDLAHEMALPPTELIGIFKSSKLSFGLEICEDLWHSDYPVDHNPFNISQWLVKKGAEAIFNLSASPWSFNKSLGRDKQVKRSIGGAKSSPFFYVNCVGVQNNGKNFICFDGDSTVYNAEGDRVLGLGERFESGNLVFAFDQVKNLPVLNKQAEARAKTYVETAVYAIKNLDEIMGNGNWPAIIGLSGGVDSALNACLLTQALGPSRVIGCNLPSKYNSDTTKGIAKALAQKLGIGYHTIAIEELSQANRTLVSDFKPSDFNYENIQAKIRGTNILSNIAGITGGLMCNNGNKVEIALGYATLYGDVNGAISPLGDCTKVDIFNMSRYLNELHQTDLIDPALLPDEDFEFAFAPSAELKTNQRDPMKWGYHDAIIERVFTYKGIGPVELGEFWLSKSLASELSISEKLLEKYGLEDPKTFVDDIEWLFRLIRIGVFKRIQAPPIVMMSRSSFGYDFRESQIGPHQSRSWQRMKIKILG